MFLTWWFFQLWAEENKISSDSIILHRTIYEGYEILAKANKTNEQTVIKIKKII